MKKFLKILQEWNDNVEFLMETYQLAEDDKKKENRPLRKVYKLPQGGKMKVPGSGIENVVDVGLTVVDPKTLDVATVVDDDVEDDGKVTVKDPKGVVKNVAPSKLGIRR